MEDKRQEMIDALRAAMAEMESEEGLVSFIEGHGLQSRVFALSWQSDTLRIDFRLPFARVLSDEEEQELDKARIGAAIRLAVLLLASDEAGKLLQDGESTISVYADDSGAGYSVADEDGAEVDSGDSFEPLVARLESSLDGEEGHLTIIWP